MFCGTHTEFDIDCSPCRTERSKRRLRTMKETQSALRRRKEEVMTNLSRTLARHFEATAGLVAATCEVRKTIDRNVQARLSMTPKMIPSTILGEFVEAPRLTVPCTPLFNEVSLEPSTPSTYPTVIVEDIGERQQLMIFGSLFAEESAVDAY